MGTHPIFESDFDCLTESMSAQEMNKNEETGFGDEFKKVESRKRKADEKMDDRPYFEPIAADKMGSKKKGAPDVRRVPIPTNRLSPLKEQWKKLYEPIVKQLKLEIRFNQKKKQVELRASKACTEISALQKGVDFVTAFTYGFHIEDVKQTLKGDHLSRAIGRISGTGGRTKYTIENVTKCRIVLADKKIHILGSYQNIQVCRRAICALILGSPPSKVYGNMRNAAARTNESF